MENNVIALRPKEEETFESFIRGYAVQFVNETMPLEEATSLLEDVFDAGLGMGYTMCEMDFKEHFEEFFDEDDFGL